MKYEIIKGSEKDFDGAPEWATQVFQNESCKANIWFVEKNKEGYRWVNHCGTMKGKVSERLIHRSNTSIAERRPITEPVWSGEGLPPVGVECEIKRVAAWLPVKIEFISNTNTIFTTRGGSEECYHTHSLTFRPARSPEDVARDEAIEDMLSNMPVEECSMRDFVAAIYDDGYRKME